MQLNTILIIFSVVLFLCSYSCFQRPCWLETFRNWLLYNKFSTLILFGSSTIVLLHKITHLSNADFGEYKCLLFMIFTIICLMSFFKVKELLSIRGLAILNLFFFDIVLDSVYTKNFFTHNIFVGFIYILIVFFIVFGASPYLFRDFLDKLMQNQKLAKIIGCLFLFLAIETTAIIFI